MLSFSSEHDRSLVSRAKDSPGLRICSLESSVFKFFNLGFYVQDVLYFWCLYKNIRLGVKRPEGLLQ